MGFQFIGLVLKAVAVTLCDIVGLFVVPVAILFTSRRADFFPRVFWLWSNDHDSINGYSNRGHWEKRYKDPRAFWPRFHWSALRNRSTNFRRVLGVKVLGDRLNIRWPIRIYKDKGLIFKLGYTHNKPGTTWFDHISDKHHFVFSLDSRTIKDG